jgi:phage terminase large subunit
MLELLDSYRYFLLDGGRGGGKSQSIARFLETLGDRYSLRIVCGREIQNSINESVYSIMTDLISSYNLNYEVFATKLIHRSTGTTINFRGFRELGSVNIQGMEGVDILWIDESQSITKTTLDVLIPTIRKQNAKVFFSMNRHVHDDPVYEFCRNKPSCLHLTINYNENKHCTQALIAEAEECRLKSEADYRHIWLGEPLTQSEDAVFGHDELESLKSIDFMMRDGYGLRIGGFDVARYGDDKCACVVIQQMGSLNWEVVHAVEWDHKDLAYTTGRILSEAQEHNCTAAVIDEDGIGAAPFDFLNRGRGLEQFIGFRNLPLSFAQDKFYGNIRTRECYKLKDLVRKRYIKIVEPPLLKELEHAFRYTYDNYQRRILVTKERMRKDGIKSPNLADALIMACSQIGAINYKTMKQYTTQPSYSREDNILSIVR